jgi:hypothetical protein
MPTDLNGTTLASRKPQAMQKHVKMAFKVRGWQIDHSAIPRDPAAAQPQSRQQGCLPCARLKISMTVQLATIHAARIMDAVTLVVMRLITSIAIVMLTNGNVCTITG